ncbi:hypothetical protein Pmani_026728 [Petrolisthes manimaculis]|uniref:Uncharacterized protein n=1 Tax=Petrolisthes manimaculis TaxID=1843537 RepID=A0AAE1TZU4_9EUCA|nr:hypothetical protein Pmani_026728 [Petrolisthes manimaculis]
MKFKVNNMSQLFRSKSDITRANRASDYSIALFRDTFEANLHHHHIPRPTTEHCWTLSRTTMMYCRSLVTLLVMVIVVVVGEASELPDRECCDSAPPPPPNYLTVTSTSTTSTPHPPTKGTYRNCINKFQYTEIKL